MAVAVATSVLQVTADYQWDSDSRYPLPDPGSAPNNCGPSCVTNIARFYLDRDFGIYSTRRLVVTDPTRGTSANEQALMLATRGVPASVRVIDSLAMLRLLVGQAGRRPVIIGVLMGLVPPLVRDHPFTGWHAIEIMLWAPGGFWYRDPNFSRAIRPDPDGGRKWISDDTLQRAFIDNSPRYAIVPDRAKPAASAIWLTVQAGAKVRARAATNGSLIATLSTTARLQAAGTTVTGGSYSWWDRSAGLWRLGTAWQPVWFNGYKRYVISPFATRALAAHGMTVADDDPVLEVGEGVALRAAAPRLATRAEGDFIISEPVGDLLAPLE